ncbi:type II-A CRISPR-associated protein Csn2 [Lactobacillus sp. Sy-1]|uniref:type II-A CRISPR-associated protein Csn2 n=1 Tax=Lactobacillus sp. Sy-1 TaxID=2109645 RepID=UPI001C5B0FA9|nr:type II-A CRISPR-associated protein Csn2 [Lactobacillus sp. Sy-1]MBW1606360.1 type II-A CRISPR-associated protein Csn2 [Lactobacillus sp. Sy-1]
MNITIYPFQPYQILDNSLNIIDIASTNLNSKIINQVRTYGDKIIFSSEDSNVISSKDAYDYYGDILISLDLDKMFIAKIEKKIEQDIQNPSITNIFDNQRKMFSIFLQEAYLLDLPIRMNFTPNVDKLLKQSKLSFIHDELNEPYPILETLVKTVTSLQDDKLIILLNLTNYLNDSELKLTNQLLADCKKTILTFNFNSVRRSLTDNYNYLFIDEDFCEWK